MTTIQKRAFELKPGDVFVWGGISVVALYVDARASDVVVRTAALNVKEGGVSVGSYTRQSVMGVGAPYLTLAQQYADELADALKAMLLCHDARAVLNAPGRAEIGALLDKIKPSGAPTLEEALAELESITNSHDDESEYAAMQRAGVLLDRARRAGLLK